MVCAPSAASLPATSCTSSERSMQATAAPSRAARVATASPSPCAAPVTTTTFPAKRSGCTMSALAPRTLDAGPHGRLGVLVVLGHHREQPREVALLEGVNDVAVILGDVADQVDGGREHLAHVLADLQPPVGLDQGLVVRGLHREQVEGRVRLAEARRVGELAV